MTTIKDIAEYTGVTATTVSNVIHGRYNRVSQETINKIDEAIKELHYVPNLFARSLVSCSSKVVALMNYVPTSEDFAFSDESFQMSFLSTIETLLRENGYYLMFRRVENAEELHKFLQNWNVDGLFITGVVDQEIIDAVKVVSLPTVLVDSYASADGICDIGLDDDGGGYIATEYLINKGHKRIAFVTSSMREGFAMRERMRGYRHALEHYNLDFDEQLVMESPVDIESCRLLAKRIHNDASITGVVSTTDIMAAGLITAFRELGIKVPEDISIIGFDDSALSQMTVPPLTTVRQDMKLKASAAAQNLIKMLKGEKAEKSRVEFPVELVIRESVSEPARG